MINVIHTSVRFGVYDIHAHLFFDFSSRLIQTKCTLSLRNTQRLTVIVGYHINELPLLYLPHSNIHGSITKTWYIELPWSISGSSSTQIPLAFHSTSPEIHHSLHLLLNVPFSNLLHHIWCNGIYLSQRSIRQNCQIEIHIFDDTA